MMESWVSVLSGLLGVLIGAGITIYQDQRKESRAKRKDGEYLAIRVVCMLDRFVKGCLDVAYDDGTSQGRAAGKDETYVAQTRDPEFPVQTIDGNWKAVRADLMYRLLGFTSRIEQADYWIGVAGDDDDFDNSARLEERQVQYAGLGIEAAELATLLRSEYAIPPRDDGEHQPLKSLRDCLDHLLKRRIEIEAVQRANPPLDILGAASTALDRSISTS